MIEGSLARACLVRSELIRVPRDSCIQSLPPPAPQQKLPSRVRSMSIAREPEAASMYVPWQCFYKLSSSVFEDASLPLGGTRRPLAMI